MNQIAVILSIYRKDNLFCVKASFGQFVYSNIFFN